MVAYIEKTRTMLTLFLNKYAMFNPIQWHVGKFEFELPREAIYEHGMMALAFLHRFFFTHNCQGYLYE